MVEECHLSRILVQNERVVAVETSKGMIECDYIVNTGGLWARNVGCMSEPQVKVPVHPAEHYFLYTQKLDGIDPLMPGRNLSSLYIIVIISNCSRIMLKFLCLMV